MTVPAEVEALAGQVTQLTELLRQNQELGERVRGAAARTGALTERFLRRFSAELHDGPAHACVRLVYAVPPHRPSVRALGAGPCRSRRSRLHCRCPHQIRCRHRQRSR